MGVFFRISRADNSVVGGPIGPKFELVRDIMHVLITCKFKRNWIIAAQKSGDNDFVHVLVTCKYNKDRMNNYREKVETPSFPL